MSAPITMDISGLNPFTCVAAWYLLPPGTMQFVTSLQAGFSPVELSELSLAHSLHFPPSPGHVHKLERYLEFGLSYHPDDSLKVIDLLSRNTHLIFLNGRLYFQLLSLDQLDNRPGRIRIHPF